jgi:hypothetical protein
VDICEPHRKLRFLCCCIYSVLHSKGSYQVVTCVFVAAEIFTESLPSNGQEQYEAYNYVRCNTFTRFWEELTVYINLLHENYPVCRCIWASWSHPDSWVVLKEQLKIYVQRRSN